MILDEINKKTLEDVKKKEKDFPLDLLAKSLNSNAYTPKPVKSYLKSTKEEPIRIIAELKKASPSKGIIKEDFDILRMALEYSSSGANAISVLTEPHYFQGNLEYLTKIRKHISKPLLRKDFILTKYQIVEALVYKADFILLIAKSLSTKDLKELYEYAINLGLEVLVEIHDKEDLKKAIQCQASIIGINHRNLETFKIDMTLCEKLIPMIPKGKIIVAESGVSNIQTIKKLSSIGADAFLIGEHFMKATSISKELISFKNLTKN